MIIIFIHAYRKGVLLYANIYEKCSINKICIKRGSELYDLSKSMCLTDES